jgi:hypothetical protein
MEDAMTILGWAGAAAALILGAHTIVAVMAALQMDRQQQARRRMFRQIYESVSTPSEGASAAEIACSSKKASR